MKMASWNSVQGAAGSQQKEGLKECPVCHAACFLDMDVCYGCLHRFGDDEEVRRIIPSGGPNHHARTATMVGTGGGGMPAVGNDSGDLLGSANGGANSGANSSANSGTNGGENGDASSGVNSRANALTVRGIPIEVPTFELDEPLRVSAADAPEGTKSPSEIEAEDPLMLVAMDEVVRRRTEARERRARSGAEGETQSVDAKESALGGKLGDSPEGDCFSIDITVKVPTALVERLQLRKG